MGPGVAGADAARRHRVFLLSPASLSGKRARLLLEDGAGDFELARALRRPRGVTLGEVFAFASSLYFRGKRAYARAFAAPPPGLEGAWVITSTRGLVPMETPVGIEDLRQLAVGSLDEREPSYREPMISTARALFQGADGRCEAVLLGSIATDRYLSPLLETWGPWLRFPEAFIGRGDMSRGGLMLRCVEEGRELAYVPAARADRRGSRPPKLEPPAHRARTGSAPSLRAGPGG